MAIVHSYVSHNQRVFSFLVSPLPSRILPGFCRGWRIWRSKARLAKKVMTIGGPWLKKTYEKTINHPRKSMVYGIYTVFFLFIPHIFPPKCMVLYGLHPLGPMVNWRVLQPQLTVWVGNNPVFIAMNGTYPTMVKAWLSVNFCHSISFSGPCSFATVFCAKYQLSHEQKTLWKPAEDALLTGHSNTCHHFLHVINPYIYRGGSNHWEYRRISSQPKRYPLVI